MIRKLAMIVGALLLPSCATIQSIGSHVPSFWDDNQSAAIIDVRQSIYNLDCEEAQAPQAEKILERIVWFELYSQSKGARQKDVLELIKPLKDSTADFVTRTQRGKTSVYYCESKKSILEIQAGKAAQATMRRF